MACNFGISIHVDHSGHREAVWGMWQDVDPASIFNSKEFSDVADRLRHCGSVSCPALWS
jgi:hypothetical protein